MSNYSKKRLTFGSAYRMGNSKNGNPTWKISFSDDVKMYRTQADSSWGYEVSNIKTGTVLDVFFTSSGLIAYANEVKK